MTAEVAILNTHGVALASDSAVTVRIGKNRHKTYNSAEKLFMLTKRQSVGLMIFNNASLMGLDWELIIKEYRRALGTKVFGTLFEYAEDFINFIKNYKHFSIEQQIDFLQFMSYDALSYIKKTFIDLLIEELPEEEEIQDVQITKLFNQNLKTILQKLKDIDDVKNFKLDEDFIKANIAKVDEIIKDVFENYNITGKQKEELLQFLLQYIQKCINSDDYSGIVVAGFGNDEILPSLNSFHIYGKLGSCLVYEEDDKDKIGVKVTDQTASTIIYPFAQTEVVKTFINGVDPNFYDIVKTQFAGVLDKISDSIGDSYKDKFEKIKEEYSDYLDAIQRNVYIDSILDMVGSLGKSDLGEMAESLVNLTAFKRHISVESETVGGPTDVAVITKGDGFIWIKRKNYFDADLNKHYFDNNSREA
jgi:nucleoid DNA-binding protein